MKKDFFVSYFRFQKFNFPDKWELSFFWEVFKVFAIFDSLYFCCNLECTQNQSTHINAAVELQEVNWTPGLTRFSLAWKYSFNVGPHFDSLHKKCCPNNIFFDNPFLPSWIKLKHETSRWSQEPDKNTLASKSEVTSFQTRYSSKSFPGKNPKHPQKVPLQLQAYKKSPPLWNSNTSGVRYGYTRSLHRAD